MIPVKVPFEGRMMNAPSNYDHYLRGLYHDYMQLPPEEKRAPKRGLTVQVNPEFRKEI